MHLEIKQNTNKIEAVDSSVISKLYSLAYEDQLEGIVSQLDSTSDVEGSISVVAADEDEVRYLAGIDPGDIKRFLNLYITVPNGNYYIKFNDSNAKSICVSKWGGTNGTGITGVAGEITYNQASRVSSANLGTTFMQNSDITSFNELQFFTGLTYIPQWAFYNCAKLQSIKLPESITSILNASFQYAKIQTIEVPDSVVSMGNNVFTQCTSLVSAKLSLSLTTIPLETFAGDILLETVILPNNITSIGYMAFSGCNRLKKLYSNDADGVFNIPEGVTNIGRSAFGNIYAMTKLIIPSTILSIGETCFAHNYSLASITVNAVIPPTLSSNVFYGSGCPIYVPAGSVNDYKNASGWSNYASRIQAIPVN